MNTRILFSHRARRVFIWIHLWLGLLLGAWFSLLGVTGSVLAWRTELGAWELSRKYPVQKPADGARMVSLSEATSALKKSFPDLDVSEISAISLPGARSSFYGFTVGRNRRTARQILLNPYSAQVLGTVAPRSGNVATIQQIHQRLIAGARGYALNGFLTVLAVPLLLSGLWLWWPSNIKQFKARVSVKREAPLHRKIYDLHNVLGVYLYLTLFVTTVTGALLVKSHMARDGLAKTWQEIKAGDAPPARESRRARGRNQPEQTQSRARGELKITPQGTLLSNDALLDLARRAVPQYEITRIQPAPSPDAAFVGSYSLPVGFATSQSISLNPYSGAVLKARETETANANQVVRGLHLGDFGGAFIKIIYTLTGIMPLGLFVSGLWLWARKKLRTKTKTPREIAVAAESNLTKNEAI
ncbi:putative iron-regulated membrane protein [Abditibacterium utsteinense]|uniref:Putative iron-regulated membrane protein n=1 Tax=Abditibacterium utsteinense TaxID=1960156 RepID=A0A2S8SWE0_9BACT|nr:PepSY-associated TM helix domain-containing protein [Abditibacterium utsteinense]PQV65113.1 putative iron-regulated membrane protein [Abditibacterium utsteinense]